MVTTKIRFHRHLSPSPKTRISEWHDQVDEVAEEEAETTITIDTTIQDQPTGSDATVVAVEEEEEEEGRGRLGAKKAQLGKMTASEVAESATAMVAGVVVEDAAVPGLASEAAAAVTKGKTKNRPRPRN